MAIPIDPHIATNGPAWPVGGLSQPLQKIPPGAASVLDLVPVGTHDASAMRLYSAKIPAISAELVRVLVDAGDIEVSDNTEVEMDVASALKEYVRVDRELTDKAKDILEQRKLPYGQFSKVKRTLAEEKDFGLGEEALTWIATQLVEGFMHSAHVEEVFAEDVTLRRRIKDVLKKHMAIDDELDAEVRQRIKNLEEGTATWELEYSRVMDQIRQKHGLKE
jgi:hypothetical protein